MNQHNQKQYEEMVKQHHEARAFETFKTCFLVVMFFIVIACVALGQQA